MSIEPARAANEIDSLTVAGEFLMCAIRAMAQGSAADDKAVQQSVLWAKSKIDEVLGSPTG